MASPILIVDTSLYFHWKGLHANERILQIVKTVAKLESKQKATSTRVSQKRLTLLSRNRISCENGSSDSDRWQLTVFLLKGPTCRWKNFTDIRNRSKVREQKPRFRFIAVLQCYFRFAFYFRFSFSYVNGNRWSFPFQFPFFEVFPFPFHVFPFPFSFPFLQFRILTLFTVYH